jgi:beta-glucosidase
MYNPRAEPTPRLRMRPFPRAALAVLLVRALPVLAQERPPYRDPAREVDERVRDLVSRMTLEEKVAQTLALWKGK